MFVLLLYTGFSGKRATLSSFHPIQKIIQHQVWNVYAEAENISFTTTSFA